MVRIPAFYISLLHKSIQNLGFFFSIAHVKSFKIFKYVTAVPFFQLALMSVFTKLYSTNIQLAVTVLLFCWYLCNTVEHSVLCKHGNKKISCVNERNSTWHNQLESVGLFWHFLCIHVRRHWNFPIYLITKTFQITNTKKFMITQHEGKQVCTEFPMCQIFITFNIANISKQVQSTIFSLNCHAIFKSQTFVRFGKQVCKWTKRSKISSILTLYITLLKQNKSSKIFFTRIFC